jgi:hypothetical protein
LRLRVLLLLKWTAVGQLEFVTQYVLFQKKKKTTTSVQARLALKAIHIEESPETLKD